MGVTPIECQGTSPLKFVALSLLLYNEHAFQQTPQDPPIRSKQEQTLQTAATQQQYRAATQQRTVNNNEQQHGSNGNRNTAEKQRNSMGSVAFSGASLAFEFEARWHLHPTQAWMLLQVLRRLRPSVLRRPPSRTHS